MVGDSVTLNNNRQPSSNSLVGCGSDDGGRCGMLLLFRRGGGRGGEAPSTQLLLQGGTRQASLTSPASPTMPNKSAKPRVMET